MDILIPSALAGFAAGFAFWRWGLGSRNGIEAAIFGAACAFFAASVGYALVVARAERGAKASHRPGISEEP